MLQSSLRAVRLLALVLWVGGLLFFAFVLAPVAFHVLPTTHEAGLVVGATLVVLHRIGVVCGLLFAVATVLSVRLVRTTLVQLTLIAFMLVITIYLQTSVLPRMEHDRALAGGDITAVTPQTPARADFDRLHPLSEKLEGAAVFAGLGVVLLLAREPTSPIAR